MQRETKTSTESDALPTRLSPDISFDRTGITTLNISLYPWATNDHLDAYRQAVEHHWYHVLDNKHVYLNWLPESEWDGGYHKVPRDHFDLFIYDTMFTDHYVAQDYLCAISRSDITYVHEINPNILSLICHDGNYYGIPIYACIYVLFYRSDDSELAAVRTFDDLVQLASRRHFIMRKPSNTLKTLNYLTLLEPHHRTKQITAENLNTDLIDRLSLFYKYSKYLLDKQDQYSFDQSSFYIGFTEDLNTMLLTNESDLSKLEMMFVPMNNHQQPQCWLDCIGIHPQTKARGTYALSLQLANAMVCSEVMSQSLQGQHYVLPTNHVTLSRLAANNSVYAKLRALIESTVFRPASSLPVMINSPISLHEQRAQAIALILAQHRKEVQSRTATTTTTTTG